MAKTKTPRRPKMSAAEAIEGMAAVRKANKQMMDAKKVLDKRAAAHNEARKDHRAAEKRLSLLIVEYTEPSLFNALTAADSKGTKDNGEAPKAKRGRKKK